MGGVFPMSEVPHVSASLHSPHLNGAPRSLALPHSKGYLAKKKLPPPPRLTIGP